MPLGKPHGTGSQFTLRAWSQAVMSKKSAVSPLKEMVVKHPPFGCCFQPLRNQKMVVT